MTSGETRQLRLNVSTSIITEHNFCYCFIFAIVLFFKTAYSSLKEVEGDSKRCQETPPMIIYEQSAFV